MTLREVITNIGVQNEEAMIFAKKVDAKFAPSSEAVLIELEDEELDSPTKKIADIYCPGFEYFLEVFVVKDLLEELKNTVGFNSLEQQIDRVIHYAEFDA